MLFTGVSMCGLIWLLLILQTSAKSLSCIAIGISWGKSYWIDPAKDTCGPHCNEDDFINGLNARLKTDDRCQGDDGFSTYSYNVDPVPGYWFGVKGIICRCHADVVAFRVSRFDQTNPDLSCKVSDYVARVMQYPYSYPNNLPNPGVPWTTGYIVRDNVHCAHQ